MCHYTIYKHTTPSGRVYIGQTKLTPSLRWKNGVGYKPQILFWRAIQKYGWDNIKHEILFEGLTKEEADQIEIELIAKYKAINMCYNISDGGAGNLGHELSDEAKAKISNSLKGRFIGPLNPMWRRGDKMKGQKRSMETRIRISNSRKGIIFTDEHRQNLSISHKGKYSRKHINELAIINKGNTNTKGRIWIHKNGQQKMVKPNDLTIYENDGWTKGRS